MTRALFSRSLPRCVVGLSLVLGSKAMAAPPTGDGHAPSDVHVYPHRPDASPQEWPLLYQVDFGPEGSELCPGAIAFDGSKPIRYVTWKRGMVRAVSRATVEDLTTRDFIEGEDAVLVLATDTTATPVRCVLTFGDAAQSRGPVRILIDDHSAGPEITTRAGEFTDVAFMIVPSQARIEIHLAGEGCASFALCAASIYAPAARKLFELPGVWTQPSPDTSEAPRIDARYALRSYTDYLLAERPIEGCYAYSGNWYESAYALRALLVAAELLRTPAYRAGAF